MARILDLADGFTSNTAPTLAGALTNGFEEFVSDAAFEAVYPGPTGGEAYYNTTLNVPRFYNGTMWMSFGQDVSAYQEVPSGTVDGINVDYDLSFTPVNDTSIFVYLNGLLLPNTDWTFSAPTITLNTAPAVAQDIFVTYLTDGVTATFPTPSGLYQHYTHTLTVGEATSKTFTLSPAPGNASKVGMIYNGVGQVYNEDYTITGSTMDFNGYGLDSFIAVSDKITVTYFS
jgi:hypothetical protein